VEFAVGTDGKIYPQQTCNLPGSFPVQLAVNPAGTFLYVVETYQPNYNANIPGPGAIVVFPINSTGGLGATSTPCVTVPNGNNQFFPVGNNPVAISILASGLYTYVINEGDSSITSLQIGSDGSLAPVGTYTVGVSPNAVASDPTNRFVYVTDQASNQVIGFLIQQNGSLVAMQRPFATRSLPDAITVDPRGQYVLVANYNDNSVSDFSVDQGTGNLSVNGNTPFFAVGTGPTCVLIEPARGIYVYTTGFLANTVSGLYMNPSSGNLSAVQNSPFAAAAQPTCSAAVTHGNHSIQTVQP
jgi:6-phosphogluconolactonase (cycloisomerase 2 family)